MTLTSTVDSIIGKVNTATSHIASSSNPHSVTKAQVGLSNVDNTSDANKPVSSATQAALNLKANQSTTYTKIEVDSAISGLVDSAPLTLNTLNELAAALGDDANFATTVTNNIATKAPLNSPTFTGTVSGVTKTMVGLGSVDNTADTAKNVLSATKLTTARTITLAGDSTGSVSFDGSANVTLTVANNTTNLLGDILTIDGTGSGIDADLLDGQHGSYYGTAAAVSLNTAKVSNVSTNLSYTTAATTGTVVSSDGTNATIPAATTTLAGLLTGTDKTKLNGIESNATADQTAAEILTAIKTVDGTGSGLDADLLDGQHGSYYGTAAAVALNTAKVTNVSTNLTYTTATTTGTVNSSDGTNATIPAATTALAGLMTNADKTKLNGIASGAQVNVATNLTATAGTTAGPTIVSSTGTNVVIPSASATESGVVTTTTQTIAGAKTFSSTITGSITGNSGTATKLATARSITLTGDVTGTATYDGTATTTISTVVADDSHAHKYLKYSTAAESQDYSLQYLNINGTTTDSPTTDWYNVIRMAHGNPNTYYNNTLAMAMTGSNVGGLYGRTRTSGTVGSWNRFFADNYHPKADSLTTARTIGGVSFNGTANIDLPGVNTAGNQSTSGNAATATALTSGNKTITGDLNATGGLTVSGSLTSGGSGSYSNYVEGADNIILKGNSTGVSGVFFHSEKDGVTINHPSDYAFIQFHPYGVGGTSGEANRLVIGVSNDADDKIVLNTTSTNGAVVRVGTGTTEYPLYHSGNIPTWNQSTTGNAATATALTSGDKTISGTLTLSGSGSYKGISLVNSSTSWAYQEFKSGTNIFHQAFSSVAQTGAPANSMHFRTNGSTTQMYVGPSEVGVNTNLNVTGLVNLGSTQQATIKYNATDNSIDFIIN